MENNLIVVKQLPVIEDQLLAVKNSIEERVATALSLVCTEETYKDIKKVRSELNKEYAELEKRRKEIKGQILAPYESFEGVYKECAGDMYAKADRELGAKIKEVEDGLKQQFREEFGDRIPISAVLIPQGSDTEEMMEIFQTIYKMVSFGEEIVFDVTHSFRSIPFLAASVLNYAKTMKNCSLRGIYYGAFEAKDDQGVTPLS